MNHTIDRLPVLVLFPHSRCNCRCIMCDIWKETEAREIDEEQLALHMEDLLRLGVESVVFSGGEPLMHTDLFRLANRLSSGGIRTTLLTTGLLLARHAEAVGSAIGDVIVSLDGPPEVHDSIRGVPGAFDRLASGIRALRRVRTGYPVAARSTVQRANFSHLRATVRTARSLGLNSISFLAADLTSTAFNRPFGWPADRQAEVGLGEDGIATLDREIEALVLEEKDLGFVLESEDKLRRIARHFRVQLGQAPPVAPRCNAPWVSAVVESDGTVRPCFFHPPIGNWNASALPEILNQPAAIEFRRTLSVEENPVCRRCVCSLYRPS